MISRRRPSARTRSAAATWAAAGAVAAGAVLAGGVATAPPATAGVTVPGTSVPAAVDPATDPALAPYYSQTLDWRSCRGGQRCTTLRVPLSYDDPARGDVGIKVLRSPRLSGSGTERIGSLLINPGGPGGSGVEFASYAPFIFSPDVLEAYDVVGFDPRGVAASDPVECLTDRQTTRWLDADPTPNDAAERQAYADLSRLMADGCQRRSPRIADHMDTELVARDMDVLRAALGDPVLHYMGWSYGTKIGATYAGLFPQRSARLVLDGALDPTLTLVSLAKGQSDGFQLAVRRFVQDCAQRRDCPLPSRTGKALSRLQSFLHGLDRRPLRAAPGRPLVEAQGITAVIGSMYDDASGWPTLRAALRAGFNGNGRPLQQITDSFTDRRPNGSYGSNANVAIYAVTCWDYPRPPGISGTRDLAREWAADAGVPALARALAWGNLPCRYWAGRTATPPQPIHAAGAPPILVIGTTNDPATPVSWARSLADQLDSGVYLEWRGDGHTAYGRGGRCPTQAVDRFLLEGIPPADGTVCR